MITGEIKSKVDRIWDTLWSGGISNPLTVIDQLTALGFMESSALHESPFSGLHADGPEGLFAGKPYIIDGLFHTLEDTLPRVTEA